MIRPSFLDVLENQARGDTLSHAYLVLGDFNFEKIILKFKINQPDIYQISESPIKIGQIRELIHWLNLKPHSSLKKVAYLRNIQTMTLEAANAMLKALEEAPEYAVLILQAPQKEKILPTILSRCQIVREAKFENKNLPEDYLEIRELSKMSIKERFTFVNTVITNGSDIPSMINLWEQNYREKLLKGDDVKQALDQISKARHLLSTNISVKLLLENLVLIF